MGVHAELEFYPFRPFGYISTTHSWKTPGVPCGLVSVRMASPKTQSSIDVSKKYCCCSVAQLCLTLCEPWTAARQSSLSFTNSQSLLKLMSMELVMPSNHLIFCRPFSSCLQSFPASGSFLMCWFFASGGQSIGVSASASVLPMNIQG